LDFQDYSSNEVWVASRDSVERIASNAVGMMARPIKGLVLQHAKGDARGDRGHAPGLSSALSGAHHHAGEHGDLVLYRAEPVEHALVMAVQHFREGGSARFRGDDHERGSAGLAVDPGRMGRRA
jgi:hypothetical protein